MLKFRNWVDEKSLKELIKNYVRSTFPDSLTKEEYLNYMGINVEDLVEFPMETELRFLNETRKKAEKRCQY